MSVIEDDGTVADIIHTTTLYNNYVHFIRPDLLTFSQDNTALHKWTSFVPIPKSDQSNTYAYNSSTYAWYANYWGTGFPANVLVSTPTVDPENLGYTAITPMGSDMISFGSSKGLGMGTLDDSPPRMISYVTTSYNSGYMVGDIKGAFLSDTDTTNVTGEKIDLTNGSVPAGNNASVASVTANQLVFQSSSETVGRYDTGTTLVTGKQYYATLTISNYSGSDTLGLASGGGFDGTFRYNANGTYTRYITGDDANEIQLFYRNTNSATVGLTIKEVDRDRSVNNTGLEVRGTITKSAVATGADLVAYSGFSNSTNYLSQPLNSDLAIGNSEFSSVGWFKKTTSSNTGMIFLLMMDLIKYLM